MDLRIRLAAPEDAEILAILARITFRETFGHLFLEHEADLRAYLDSTFAVAKIRNSLCQPENTYWLASVDALPAGYAKLKFPSSTPLLPHASVAQLQKIYVLKEFLGRRIGKPLLCAALDRAASHRAEYVWLDVLKQNTRAIDFYKRHGFTALGEDTYSIGVQTFRFHLMTLQGPAVAT